MAAVSKKYRLDVLLKIREREKKKAEEALARAITALARARKREEELVDEKKKIHADWVSCRSEMRGKMDMGGKVGEGNVYVRYLRKLKEEEDAKQEEIDKQREEIKRCEDKVAACRRAYIDAAKNLQVMEKHKDLWRRKLAAELSRKEEREFDELGNIIHQRRHAKE